MRSGTTLARTLALLVSTILPAGAAHSAEAPREDSIWRDLGGIKFLCAALIPDVSRRELTFDDVHTSWGRYSGHSSRPPHPEHLDPDRLCNALAMTWEKRLGPSGIQVREGLHSATFAPRVLEITLRVRIWPEQSLQAVRAGSAKSPDGSLAVMAAHVRRDDVHPVAWPMVPNVLLVDSSRGAEAVDRSVREWLTPLLDQVALHNPPPVTPLASAASGDAGVKNDRTLADHRFFGGIERIELVCLDPRTNARGYRAAAKRVCDATAGVLRAAAEDQSDYPVAYGFSAVRSSLARLKRPSPGTWRIVFNSTDFRSHCRRRGGFCFVMENVRHDKAPVALSNHISAFFGPDMLALDGLTDDSAREYAQRMLGPLARRFYLIKMGR